MQMTLLSIIVWFTHFLIASAFNFSTMASHTLNDYTETVTLATTTNQEPKTLIKPSSPMTTTTNLPTEVHNNPNTTPMLETTSQDDTMDENVSISTASHVAISDTQNSSTNFVRLMPQNDELNETLSYNDEGHTFQPNTIPTVGSREETTSLDQPNSSPSQNDTIDGDVSISNASDASYTNTRQTTSLANLASLLSQRDENGESGTMSNVSSNDDGHTFQTNTIPTVGSTQETTFLDQPNSSPSQNDTIDGDVSISNASDASYTNTRQTTSLANLTSLLSQRDENGESGTMSNVSSNDDGHTFQTNTIPTVGSTQETTFLDQFNDSLSPNDTLDGDVSLTNASDFASPSPVSTNFTRPRKDENNKMSYNDFQTPATINNFSTNAWTEKEDEVTKDDKGNYETNPTQALFANMSEQLRGTRGTEGSYNFTNDHREEHYNTTAHTINVQTDWSTSQNTDIPMTTPAYTISQDPFATDEPQNHTSTGGANYSTRLQDLFRFTHNESENMAGTDTPIGTTNMNNNSTTVNNTNAKTNKTDTESKVWPTCLNSTQKSRMACFITVWTLAMTATIFLGVTIFLWVRLSVIKEKVKRKERGHASEKENLWTDQKASVQERVEFWYINGSTLEADRKEKDRKKHERMKKRGQEQVNEENGLWVQPRVTLDDITEFWYANRRIREDRTQNMGL